MFIVIVIIVDIPITLPCADSHWAYIVHWGSLWHLYRAFLPVEWAQPQYFIHSSVNQQLPCVRHHPGHWSCKDKEDIALLWWWSWWKDSRTDSPCPGSCIPYMPPHWPTLPTTSIQDKDPSAQLRQQRWIWAPAHQGLGPASFAPPPAPSFIIREAAHALDHSLDPLHYLTSANPCSSFYDLILSPAFCPSLPNPLPR